MVVMYGNTLMIYLVALFGLMMIGLSAFGTLQPIALFKLVRRAADGPFMLIAVSTRLFMALILWLAAPEARQPAVFRVLAIIALVAAFVILLVGKPKLMQMIEWWAGKPVGIQRAWILLGLLFGGYLVWAIWPALGL